MKTRLTKLFTVLLTAMLVVGMAPATGSAAYAASWNSGSSFSSLFSGLFGGSADKSTTEQNKSEANEVSEDTVVASNNTLAAVVDETTSSGDDGLNISKSITKNDDGTYTINLEAYATGTVEVSEVDTYKPTDIVLVLDQSASMLKDFNNTKDTYTQYTSKTNSDLYSLASNDQLYVLENGKYIKVTVEPNWKSTGWFSGYYIYTYSYNGNTFSSEKDNGTGPSWDFYKKTTTVISTMTREEALEAAVTNFVNQIQATAVEKKVDYRVAIVGYGGYAERNYKNTEILTTSEVVNYANAKDTDYKNALVSVNDNGSLNSRVSTAIDRIIVQEDTATSADYGMEMAQKVLANNPSTDRNKVVVMFTDGEPNHGDGFSTTVANTTIKTSNTIKNGGAKVFTVGILENADPDDTTTNINKYMNYVSSNYPNATNLSTPGTGSNKGYYMNADNASQLNTIFEKISSSIETPSSSVTLGAQTVLKDIITDNFTLPENVDTSDIKVFTEDFNGKNASGEYTWTNRQPFAGDVAINGKTVDVSGFDYSSNYAVTVSGENKGKKLIVQIPVNIVRTFGGNNIPSNEDTSGIYDNGSIVKAFEVPDVDAPIDYQIAGTETWINEGEEVSLADLVGYTADGDFEYKADGKKNKFVDLIYTIKDANGNVVGTYTIKAGETTGTASGTTGALAVDTTYTVECKVRPITEGTTKETTVQSATSYVYIRNVDKAFVIDFAKPITYARDEVFSKNQTSTDAKVNAIELASATNTYGDLTLNGDKSITYALKDFMNGIDTYTFKVACKADTQTVKMIPATSVYYEDNFGEETDADGNTTNSIITYDSNWTVVKDGNVVTSINGEDPVGYDSAYEGNTKYSSGSAHMAKATDTAIKATFKFTGSGIDLYGYTDNNTGRMRIQLYELDENDQRISSTATYTAIVDTKYNSGQVYQTPLFSYMGEKTCRYEAVVTVGKGSTIYLDAMRVYYPIGNTNENYTDNENAIKYVDIRDQIFNPEYFSVSGILFVDEHADANDTVAAHTIDLANADDKSEYSTYGRKREVAIAPGDSVTLSGFAANTSVKQIGMRTNSEALEEFKIANPTGKVKVNDTEINLTSATDMYYNVTVKDGKLVITNNTNYIITLTNLKLK